MTLLPLLGIGLGCLGEASNQMFVRRRYVLGMGCIMAIFGLSTNAWGLVFKNVVSDVGATLYAVIKYRDPPLLTEYVRRDQRAAGRLALHSSSARCSGSVDMGSRKTA